MFIKTQEFIDRQRAAESIYQYACNLLGYVQRGNEVPASVMDGLCREVESFNWKYCRPRYNVETKDEYILGCQNAFLPKEISRTLERIAYKQEKTWACNKAYSLGVIHGKRAERARNKQKLRNLYHFIETL